MYSCSAKHGNHNNYYWKKPNDNNNYYYSQIKLFLSSQKCGCYINGLVQMYVLQVSRHTLISSFPVLLGRPFRTKRGTLISIQEDLGKDTPKVPHYKMPSYTIIPQTDPRLSQQNAAQIHLGLDLVCLTHNSLGNWRWAEFHWFCGRLKSRELVQLLGSGETSLCDSNIRYGGLSTTNSSGEHRSLLRWKNKLFEMHFKTAIQVLKETTC